MIGEEEEIYINMGGEGWGENLKNNKKWNLNFFYVLNFPFCNLESLRLNNP